MLYNHTQIDKDLLDDKLKPIFVFLSNKSQDSGNFTIHMVDPNNHKLGPIHERLTDSEFVTKMLSGVFKPPIADPKKIPYSGMKPFFHKYPVLFNGGLHDRQAASLFDVVYKDTGGYPQFVEVLNTIFNSVVLPVAKIAIDEKFKLVDRPHFYVEGTAGTNIVSIVCCWPTPPDFRNPDELSHRIMSLYHTQYREMKNSITQGPINGILSFNTRPIDKQETYDIASKVNLVPNKPSPRRVKSTLSEQSHDPEICGEKLVIEIEKGIATLQVTGGGKPPRVNRVACQIQNLEVLSKAISGFLGNLE